MPQRFQDSGKIVPIRIYQTITNPGDMIEGAIDLESSETNMLEMVCQSWRHVFIEGRNDGRAKTTQKIYGTRKFNTSVPGAGEEFWNVSEDHWELLETQTDIANSTNADPLILTDKGYTYIVVTGEGPTGQAASSYYLITFPLTAGDVFTINGLTYTGVSGTPSDNSEFSVDGNFAADVGEGIAAAINADTRTGITVPSLDVSAVLEINRLVITCTTSSYLGNDIGITSDTTRIVAQTPTLTAGRNGTSSYISRAILTA